MTALSESYKEAGELWLSALLVSLVGIAIFRKGEGTSKSIYWVSPIICSRTLMGCSDPSIVLSGGGGGTPSGYSRGLAACDLLFMLTAALRVMNDVIALCRHVERGASV